MGAWPLPPRSAWPAACPQHGQSTPTGTSVRAHRAQRTPRPHTRLHVTTRGPRHQGARARARTPAAYPRHPRAPRARPRAHSHVGPRTRPTLLGTSHPLVAPRRCAAGARGGA
eukprot:5807368-Prymnesium_polylepis.1